MEQNATTENTLLVGTIVAPFGIRGQVKMRALTDHIDHLRRNIRTLYLGPTFQPYRLVNAFVHKPGFVVLSLEGVDTREGAENLRNVDAAILASQAVPLAADEYFLHDLPGLRVENEQGELIGSVRDYLETGANDVLVVSREGGGEVLIPLIRDVVIELDFGQRRIVIRPLPGLL